MTDFEQKQQCNQQACTDQTIQTMDGWSCNNGNDSDGKGNNRITPGNLQKGAGGWKFHSAVCLWEYTQYSRVRNTFTAASYFKVCLDRIGNLNYDCWVKTNGELVWAKSYLDAQILTNFLWSSAEIWLETLFKSSKRMMWSLMVMWPSIGDDMGHCWWNKHCN